MPIYEYSCEKCHHVFEEWVRHIDDNVDQTCPDCGAPAHRIVSNTSFVLKGGGWYVTDYGYRKGKDEGKASASGASSTPAASGSSGGETGAGASSGGASASASTGSAPAASSGSGASGAAASAA